MDVSLRGTGVNQDRRSYSDMIKDYYGEKAPSGLTDKEQKELIRQARDEGKYKDTSAITDLTKKGLDRFADLNSDKKASGEPGKGEMSPPSGDPGKQGPDPSKSPQKATLDTIVQSILDLVIKIEPKLPVAALVA